MRQGGQYVDSRGNAYEIQQHLNSENEKSSHGPSTKGEGHWRWDRDGSSHMFNQGQAGGDASRSYYHGQGQGQRSDQIQKQGNELRSQPREEDMEIGYEENFAGHQTFESLEQRFYDEIFKLTKEQNDAEDAENARHRERVNAINAQYEEQLGALRARHTNRRDEFLRRESHARQQQYQQAAMEHHQYHPNNNNSAMGMGMGGFPDHHQQQHHHQHGYNVDSYRDRPRFTTGGGGGNNRDSRDPGFEPRGGGGGGQYPPHPHPPPGARVYGSDSRYY